MKLVIISALLVSVFLNQKGQPSRFERIYRECSSNECKERVNDDNCIYNCMSKNCYETIYENYLLEYGEINQELKSKFEKCFNANK
jgi:hypothetical protein